MIKFGYLIGDLIFLTIWLLLFWKRRDLRKEMLAMSVIVAIMGPISEYWYFRDYWQPPLIWRFHPLFGGFEDVLFGFVIGGITAVLYEEILNQRLVCRGRKQPWIIPIIFFIPITSLILLNNLLGVNSIFVSCVSLILIFLIMMRFRPDLAKDAILSGLFLASVMFIIYFLYLPFFLEHKEKGYLLHDKPWAIWIFGRVPITEMLWAFCWGMVGGPVYEFWQGCRLKKG